MLENLAVVQLPTLPARPLPWYRDRRFWAVLLLAWLSIATQAADLYPLDPDEAGDAMSTWQVLDGKWPVWLATQKRYAAWKCYLDAPLLALFGPQDWTVRLSSLLLRLAEPPLAMLCVGLLLGRRAALAAGLIAGLWPGQMSFWVLGAQGLAQCVFLWYAMLAGLVLTYRSGRSGAPLGALCGLALWSGIQSILVVAPTVAAYFVCTHGQGPFKRRLLSFALPFALGCAPWWLDGLAHGFFQDRHTYFAPNFATGNDNLPSWLVPLDNWAYYFTWLLPDITHNRLAYLGVLLSLGGAVWALAPRLRSRPDRDTCFWVVAVGGTLLAWLVGVGFTTPGRWRDTVHRFCIPCWYLLPLLVPLAAGGRTRHRGWRLAALTLALCLPALGELAQLGRAHPNYKRAFNQPDRYGSPAAAYAARAQLRELVRQHGVTYVMGRWWEALDSFAFWSHGQVGTVLLDEGPVVPVVPVDWPRPGPGLLLMDSGGAFERSLERRGDLAGLAALPAPSPLRALLLPEKAPPFGMAPELLAMVDYSRAAQEFIAGRRDEVDLGPGLLSESGERQGAELTTRKSGAFVRGPWIQVPAGSYAVEFVLSGGGPTADSHFRLQVSSERGGVVLWQRAGELHGAEEERYPGAFELDSPRWLETRLDASEVVGSVTLRHVWLRRLPKVDREEKMRADQAWERSIFGARAERFVAGATWQLWLTPGVATRGATWRLDAAGLPVLALRATRDFGVYGPYLELPPGDYRLDVNLGRGRGRLVGDVLLGDRTVWKVDQDVTRADESYVARFSVTKPAKLETRLWVREGALELRGLLLCRLR